MSSVNGTRCCAKCKSPYGHVASAGRCCHPVAPVAELRGSTIRYAEIDGVPVCMVDGEWCERELGHKGPHVFPPDGEAA